MTGEGAATCDRSRDLSRASEDVWDVLIIGGGITGAGVARDAAMRGFSTLLLEQNDFASATSSASSCLLHGGLRYLAQGHIGLVRQASREKGILRKIAPHLASPLRFVFPTRRGTPWTYWKLRMGVRLYDWLCLGENFGPSRGLSRSEVLHAVPALSGDGLTGAVEYHDGFTCDSRLVIDNGRSAVASGATLVNYVLVQETRRENGRWIVECFDKLTGTSFTSSARAIVNATGSWSDRWPASSTRLRLTKGVHLIVDREKLSIPSAVVMSEGKRILFAIPWGDRTILGTTDTDYAGPLDDVRCDVADAEYILSVVRKTFPSVSIEITDIRSTWAGLRPLVWDDAAHASEVSRSHRIRMPHPGWIDVTGGKLTTYRLMAEHVVDQAAAFLGTRSGVVSTAKEPLLPPDQTTGISGVIPPDPSESLVRHFCEHEWAVHLEDVMVRRTKWIHYREDHGEMAGQVVGWMRIALGWDEQRCSEELARYHAACRRLIPG